MGPAGGTIGSDDRFPPQRRVSLRRTARDPRAHPQRTRCLSVPRAPRAPCCTSARPSLRKRVELLLPAAMPHARTGDGAAHRRDRGIPRLRAGGAAVRGPPIKRHRPPFNVMLRDDKSYPYIAVTLARRLPAGAVQPRATQAGHPLLRPFSSAKRARHARPAHRIFPYRPCRGPQPGRQSGVPCLDYHIERCAAPASATHRTTTSAS